MSVCPAKVTPHSRPARTSATSSLKRRSDAIVAVVDDDVVARDARLQRLADKAFGDEQAGRLAMLAGREDLADLGAADDGLDASAARARRPSPARTSSVRS